jgi:hypothetical protein
MNTLTKLSALLAALGLATASLAQAPADAPAGTNGVCKDGTYSQAAQKRGACRGHQGVKEWYGSASGSSAGSAAGSGTAAAPAAAAAPPASSSAASSSSASPAVAAPSTNSSSKKPSAFTPPADAAPGGGPGKVWINSSSNVYHCPGDKWYGKTKHGEYMSEADAKAKGARPDHGKACQS